MALDRIGRDVAPAGDFFGRKPLADQLNDRSFLGSYTVVVLEQSVNRFLIFTMFFLIRIEHILQMGKQPFQNIKISLGKITLTFAFVQGHSSHQPAGADDHHTGHAAQIKL